MLYFGLVVVCIPVMILAAMSLLYVEQITFKEILFHSLVFGAPLIGWFINTDMWIKIRLRLNL
jgi:hypothetical protein